MLFFVMLFCLIIVLVNSISVSSRYNIGIPSDCGDIDIKKGSGVYMIYPEGVEDGFNVYCNMETDNVGGEDGRGWNDYKFGFGTLDGEHWLGNNKLNIITNQDKYELLITMQDFTNHTGYAKYANFKIGNEGSKFKITISSYTGNVGDSLSNHNGKNFTTKDQDNDEYGSNCASSFKGAWWYGSCHDSNLNAQYLGGKHTSHADGINWKAWKGHNYSLKTTNMMIRKKK
ncbi:Tenascin-R,Ryncolin-2,Angiopoietin-related protein 1,Techylectin-5B,Ficolin-1-A,Fibrinogen C domain-containing protein 1-A,Fibrinogen C domain-containing protein 1,Fibrinogen C domain-containing protein 1-B,Ryncolin-1,Ficolin-2,Ficolin-1,Microfibril-associated glycoprotein 4,Ficolin-1-B,Ryncolin-3,Angiopoietin-related protein 2,Techylectin-5A,Ryncolin-4 [Mytilus edulis]|uniref:Fibrinogen C-terminal domain-containing protein n=1 Tax=Mytilus edulis TaxID=6550 RepID=A0A8S3UHG4_MYTED|nr:Tenascin-R,Ryncolin-2,Angiopoietin-related protein 1,Techylectin-5B,Ficolin-1-A,Fibrinogen C domain-containing protein 1-A,Fibrinogen C domain-containing protein 1,Fibrinogen C domain-containing protein 1-B,Ryncolin-1,Ficolin-2,Ficolin-1,Microfibril-associated glycoprotein 4,Ficolin-1-B,Ryncolin-3,Angiopoietin-related protein 2,Techylectin-5A,Ryncolin-4 [Mytilus edulis]